MITVIYVVRNVVDAGRADAFRRMAASVAAQTHKALEHLVIDGASTDGTQDLIAVTAHPRMRWLSEPDTGIYDAMAKGADRARGDVLNFLGADDWFHDTDAAGRAAAALSDKAANFTYGTARVARADGTTRLLRPRLARFLRGMPFCHQTQFLRRAAFVAVGGFDTRLRLIADQKLITQLLLSGSRGVDLGPAAVTFTAGGASSDRNAVALEKAQVFSDLYAPMLPECGGHIWDAAARRNALPGRLVLRLMKHGGVVRRAALHELRNTALTTLGLRGGAG